jgi:hypothetical protein
VVASGISKSTLAAKHSCHGELAPNDCVMKYNSFYDDDSEGLQNVMVIDRVQLRHCVLVDYANLMGNAHVCLVDFLTQ